MSEDQSSVVTLKVRVTPEFREKIVETAKANNRSMNQEIVSRLEESFKQDVGSIADYEKTVEEMLINVMKNLHQKGVHLEVIDDAVGGAINYIKCDDEK